jgi:hypothetical protein
MKITIVLMQPPPSFFAPHPAISARKRFRIVSSKGPREPRGACRRQAAPGPRLRNKRRARRAAAFTARRIRLSVINRPSSGGLARGRGYFFAPAEYLLTAVVNGATSDGVVRMLFIEPAAVKSGP